VEARVHTKAYIAAKAGKTKNLDKGRTMVSVLFTLGRHLKILTAVSTVHTRLSICHQLKTSILAETILVFLKVLL